MLATGSTAGLCICCPGKTLGAQEQLTSCLLIVLSRASPVCSINRVGPLGGTVGGRSIGFSGTFGSSNYCSFRRRYFFIYSLLP